MCACLAKDDSPYTLTVQGERAIRLALDAPKMLLVLEDFVNDTLRTWLKHGHNFTNADEALIACRTKLLDAMTDHGIHPENYEGF